MVLVLERLQDLIMKENHEFSMMEKNNNKVFIQRSVLYQDGNTNSSIHGTDSSVTNLQTKIFT